MRTLSNVVRTTHKTGVELTILTLILIALLLPFLNKAFTIDDPLFIWSARHILTSPLDFYGFTANWYGTETAMASLMQNPPLTAYYIAVVLQILGESEVALHLAFALFSIAAVLGTYYLAREFSADGFTAALICLATPAFLVSGTAVMSDTMMLSLWIWGILLWVRGVRKTDNVNLFMAAVLICLCAMTKYFGLSLVPLLLVYTIQRRRRLDCTLLYLFIPVLILCLYQWYTASLYGKGLVQDAIQFAGVSLNTDFLPNALRTSAFIGGGFITTLFFAPIFWKRNALVMVILGSLIFALSLPLWWRWTGLAANGRQPDWHLITHYALFTVAGCHLLFLACTDLVKNRDEVSLLLFLWIMGTVACAVFIYPMGCVRYLLPLAPAAGILVCRRIGNLQEKSVSPRWRIFAPISIGILSALLVSLADYRWADSGRAFAATVAKEYGGKVRGIFFQGHWGFQYYMEKNGASPLDVTKTVLKPGDILLTPATSTLIHPVEPDAVTAVRKFSIAQNGFVSVMNAKRGTGFYVAALGPLPYALGNVLPENYYVSLVHREITFNQQ